MIKCVRCATENLETAQYCDECGAPLIQRRLPGAEDSKGESSANQTMVENEKDNQVYRVEPVISGASWVREVENSAPASQPRKNETAVVAKLRIERGKSEGKEFILNADEINIGRWDADNGIFPDVDLDPDDPEAKVSRRHARIIRQGGRFLIEDLGSTNGTFVNRGRRLLPGNRQLLNDGDEIIVGKTFLRFQIVR